MLAGDLLVSILDINKDTLSIRRGTSQAALGKIYEKISAIQVLMIVRISAPNAWPSVRPTPHVRTENVPSGDQRRMSGIANTGSARSRKASGQGAPRCYRVRLLAGQGSRQPRSDCSKTVWSSSARSCRAVRWSTGSGSFHFPAVTTRASTPRGVSQPLRPLER